VTDPGAAEAEPTGLPVTGAWRVGDPPGDRRFAAIGATPLEWAPPIPGVVLAYETWGTFTGDNAVLVEHALTGDAHVVGEPGPGQATGGWWEGLIGPGLAVDTDRWYVVAPNALGGCGGSTGPSSPRPSARSAGGDSGWAPATAWGSRFPRITIRDQVAAELQLAAALGIDRWALVLGGSMGGMRALEWAIMAPSSVQRLMLLATGAAATAEQIALCSAQIAAIKADPHWRGGDYYDEPDGPAVGMGIARRIAHISYRGARELEQRFGRSPQNGESPERGGRYAIESYLDHQAAKLARRFDAGSYVTLSEAMNSHDVGRGRGGLAAALGEVTARTAVVSIDTDRLYRPRQQAELAEGISGAELITVHSPYGHDGFLLEIEAISAALRALLG
jgi:homoserine O-acetyltransferase